MLPWSTPLDIQYRLSVIRSNISNINGIKAYMKDHHRQQQQLQHRLLDMARRCRIMRPKQSQQRPNLQGLAMNRHRLQRKATLRYKIRQFHVVRRILKIDGTNASFRFHGSGSLRTDDVVDSASSWNHDQGLLPIDLGMTSPHSRPRGAFPCLQIADRTLLLCR